MSKFCKKCGSELKENSRFCSNCGEVVKSSTDEVVYARPRTAKKSGNSHFVITIIILIAVILAIVFGIIIHDKFKTPKHPWNTNEAEVIIEDAEKKDSGEKAEKEDKNSEKDDALAAEEMPEEDSENKAVEDDKDDKPQSADKEIKYRVRNSANDASTQIGAFSELENAKKMAEENKEDGYKVFDMNGKLIYSP